MNKCSIIMAILGICIFCPMTKAHADFSAQKEVAALERAASVYIHPVITDTDALYDYMIENNNEMNQCVREADKEGITLRLGILRSDLNKILKLRVRINKIDIRIKFLIAHHKGQPGDEALRTRLSSLQKSLNTIVKSSSRKLFLGRRILRVRSCEMPTMM